MRFISSDSRIIHVNPLDPSSIDAAKAQAPGQGVGPAVCSALIEKIVAGDITNTSQLPPEYQHVGTVVGLPA